MKRILLLLIVLVPVMLAAQVTPEAKERAAGLVKQMTLKEKIDYIGGYNGFYIRGIERLGIPEIRMADGPQGVRNDTKSTMYASGVAAAATWNRDIVYNMGVGLGQDSRARGVHILLGPGVNIYRSPLCGRNFEYFGEDPYLSSETAVQYIKGVQSQGVMATIKHFAANNQEYDRHHVSSDVDERTLQEIYFPAFRKAVQQAGVGAVMSSYNPLNGVHTSENAWLIKEVLRGQWGFEGIFMSDWNATYSGAGAANGGLDLEMPYARFMNADYLIPLVESGVVPEKVIDEKVQNILQTLISFGFFDRPQLDGSIPMINDFSNGAALNLARESIVLLKNDDILPLTKKSRNVLFMGPCADTIYTGGGSGFVHPYYTVSAIDGMRKIGKPFRVSTLIPETEYDLTRAGFYTSRGGGEKGMLAEYFTNKELAGEPYATLTETNIKRNWGKGVPLEGMPEDGFSIRWTGLYRPAKDETVRLHFGGDDGYRLFIDGEYVDGHWSNHSPTSRDVEYRFSAGREYELRFEYYDNKSSAEVEFGYEVLDPSGSDKMIKDADVVVVCVGFNSHTEKENSDRTFSLPAGQDDLILDIVSRNPNVIVVVNSGGGIDMSPWLDKVKAVLMAWYPGQEGGLAIAEILAGRISPSGRLPITIEKRWEDNPARESYYPNQKNEYRGETYRRVNYNEGIFVGYRGYDRTGVEPQFPFGYGMSYASFVYSNMDIVREGDAFRVSFDIRNNSRIAAAEVAQVYVTDSSASVPRPKKELKGFEKVYLKAGETRRVSVLLDDEAFAFYDVAAGKFVVESGDFVISVGGSSADLILSKSVGYKGDTGAWSIR